MQASASRTGWRTPADAYGTTVIGAAKAAATRLNALDPAVATYAPNQSSAEGLQQALKAQGKNYDAGLVEKEFAASWKGGSALKMDDLV